MKLSTPIIGAIAAIMAQAGIAYFVTVACWGIGRLYDEVLTGCPLPFATILTRDFGVLLPLVAALSILVAMIVPRFRKRLTVWMIAVLLIEALLLAYMILALALPTLTITYELGSL